MRKLQDWIYYIDEDSLVEGMLNDITSKIISCDTETTGLDPTCDGTLRLVQIYCPESNTAFIFDIWKLNQESRDLIALFLESNERIKIFHNAKFDLKFLKFDLDCQIIDKVFCTMLAHQLAVCGEEGHSHSLAALVHKYFNITLDKSEQVGDWGLDILPDEKLIYSALDVKYLHLLREKLKEELKSTEQMEVARLEFDAICAFVEIELTGMTLNVKRWIKNYQRQKIRMTRLQIRVTQMLKPMQDLFGGGMPTFNLSSHKQLKDNLRANGIPIPMKRDKATGVDKESTGIDQLEKIKDAHPSIPLLIKYGSIKQYHNAFGEKYLRHVNPSDGRLHPNIKQIGPITGRTSFYDPNLQQVPQLGTYRGCFISADGKKFIISDYSQIELRILAHKSGDPKMIEAFTGGHDLHRYTASLVFGVELDKVSTVQRRRAKDLNFGIVYGIGPDKFALSSGLTKHQGEKLMSDYFKVYRVLDKWLQSARQEGRVMKQSRTSSGRLVKYHYDEGDRIGASKAERNGMNTPIQGTSADISKLALGRLKREYKSVGLGREAKICHMVHDEIITEVKEEFAQVVSEIQERIMIEAGEFYINSVPIKIDTHIADKWKK